MDGRTTVTASRWKLAESWQRRYKTPSSRAIRWILGGMGLMNHGVIYFRSNRTDTVCDGVPKLSCRRQGSQLNRIRGAPHGDWNFEVKVALKSFVER
jgi:hypothetical protein